MRGWYYTDNSGLSVTTAAAAVEQPVSREVAVHARAAVDRIVVERKQLEPETHTHPDQPTGHPPHDPDTVTSASATAGGGEVADKWRVEAGGGASIERVIGGAPSEARLSVRGSTEEDYGSLSGIASVSSELFERNLLASVFVGYGRDTVTPVEAPPGQRDQWPASHARVLLGGSVTQLLAPWLAANAAFAVTHQYGTLENPYRRALVVTSLFPESVPDTRTRFTAFAGVSISPRVGTAFHVRHGFYADSWGVLAFVPEAAVAQELGDRVLVTLRYRFYRQLAADFYEGRYAGLEQELTGDMRLGPIHEHVGGVELRWTVLGERRGFGHLALLAGYELSALEYELLATDTIVAHVPSVGLGFAW